MESRYRALDLEPLTTEDCYLATLELVSTMKSDQRSYHVIVENDRGSDRRSLLLRVDEPGQVNHYDDDTIFIRRCEFDRSSSGSIGHRSSRWIHCLIRSHNGIRVFLTFR